MTVESAVGAGGLVAELALASADGEVHGVVSSRQIEHFGSTRRRQIGEDLAAAGARLVLTGLLTRGVTNRALASPDSAKAPRLRGFH